MVGTDGAGAAVIVVAGATADGVEDIAVGVMAVGAVIVAGVATADSGMATATQVMDTLDGATLARSTIRLPVMLTETITLPRIIRDTTTHRPMALPVDAVARTSRISPRRTVTALPATVTQLNPQSTLRRIT